MPGPAPEAARRRRWARIALVVGLVGIGINLVDWAVSGDLVPSDVFPLLVAAGAGAELAKGRARRALRAVAATAVAVAGLAAGVPAAAAVLRGEPFAWLDLMLGVLVVLYLVVLVMAAVARVRARASSPA
ncbi:hypothetical protein [Streptomyces sp. NPDC000410]|uniref:hypothetical protein n=1 Tax=Streptomyces sp. NPDC000410 TaxID=3154254 RepID=UPI003333B070